MDGISFNLQSLFLDAFGVAPKFVINDKAPETPGISYKGLTVITPDKAEATSLIGTPVMFPITFAAGQHQMYYKGDLVQRLVSETVLPYTTIAQFNRDKNITTTRLSGGYGSVKEMYGHNDWNITLQGLILAKEGKYDADTLEKLLVYEGLADSIEVRGRAFELLGIFRLCIVSIDLSRRPGAQGVQPFVLNCVSDEPFELLNINKDAVN